MLFSYLSLFHKVNQFLTNQSRFKANSNLKSPLECHSEWLLIVEDLGVKVFTSDILKLKARATVCLSRVEYDLPLFQRERNNLGEYNYDNDQEMVDMDIPSTLITSPTKVAANDCAKKRKDAAKDDTHIPVKYGKCQLHESVTRCRFFPLVNGDSLSRGNEVNNPVSGMETQHAPAN